MKKLLLIALLLFSTASLADENKNKYTLCAEVTIRFTLFLESASTYKTEQEYKAFWYKVLVKGDADKDSQRILSQLIDLAWINRGKDITDIAMQFYQGCASGVIT
jgi:hypothetical protein